MADVAVVGAGIVGASVAYHAARAGAEVVLLERSLPASGVTGDSFAWIGGPGGRDAVDGSTPLRRTALDDYRRLERELPEVQVRWSGSFAWGKDALSDIDALGPDEQLVDSRKPVGWNRTCGCHRHERWLGQLMGRSTPSP
jgi:glycine/D-amino acid oxidase-like deaminating enzyme